MRASKMVENAPSYKPESRTGNAVKVGTRLGCATEVWAALEDIRHANQEHFVCFDVNTRHRVIAKRIVSIGSLNGVEVHPREVFRQAIINGAAAVIMAHNHPSGDPSPSIQDNSLTKRLREVGELCGIPVLDHVVVAGDNFVSMAEKGWM